MKIFLKNLHLKGRMLRKNFFKKFMYRGPMALLKKSIKSSYLEGKDADMCRDI